MIRLGGFTPLICMCSDDLIRVSSPLLNALKLMDSPHQRRFEDVNRRLGTLETDVAWIKGKLEGTQEGNQASVWQIITTATAVGAVIIALIALLKQESFVNCRAYKN